MNWLQSFLSGGTAEATVTVDELASELKHHPEPPFVLDVRRRDEFDGGHVAEAALIPLDQLPARINELPRDRRIVCVCRSGARSGTATVLLRRHGFDAYNMRGGMLEWSRQGHPIEKNR